MHRTIAATATAALVMAAAPTIAAPATAGVTARAADITCHGNRASTRQDIWTDTWHYLPRRAPRSYRVRNTVSMTYWYCPNRGGAALVKVKRANFCVLPDATPSTYRGVTFDPHYFEPGYTSVNPGRTPATIRCIRQNVHGQRWMRMPRNPGYTVLAKVNLVGFDQPWWMRAGGDRTKRIVPQNDRTIRPLHRIPRGS